MCNILVFIAVLGLTLAESFDRETASESSPQSQFCMDINNQRNLDINQVSRFNLYDSYK